MNLANGLALATATLSFTTCVVTFMISRAPGWRFARTISALALTAGLYSLGNLVFVTPGLSDRAYLAAVNWNYGVVGLHIIAWLAFVFGGPEGSLRAMSSPVRALAAVLAIATAIGPLTGILLHDGVVPFEIPWAGFSYHYGQTTIVGDLYQAFMVAALCVPYLSLCRRLIAGERRLRLVVAGFTVFLACGVLEGLVASRVIVFVSPADLGFLAVVAPTCAQMVQRFVIDARRLGALSGRLAGEVRDRTSERDRAESALRESERLAALGQLAAGVGHEINNPLTYLQLAIAELREQLGPKPAARALEAVEAADEGAQRIERVVDGLRTYSRRPPALEAVDVSAVARAALRLAQPQIRHVAELKVALDATPRVLGDEARLVQALVNLLVNAAQAVSGRDRPGLVTLRTTTSSLGDAVLEVEDDGPGIRAADRAHLAEPYFTTRGSQGGLGLGLFVTRGIVDGHGGRLEIDSDEGRGTRARIVLPANPAAGEVMASEHQPEPRASDAAVAAPPAAESLGGKRPSLLLVDDEPTVVRFLARALGASWEVSTAGNGAEALRRLSKTRFDALLCDLEMPEFSGMQLAAELERLAPDLYRRTVFLSGGAVTPEAQAFLAREGVVHLGKPVRLAELEAALRAALAMSR